MERKVAWSRPVEEGAKLVYRSKCGRYTITRRYFASARNGHFNDVSYGFNQIGSSKTSWHESLRDAKDEADMANDPSWEP